MVGRAGLRFDLRRRYVARRSLVGAAFLYTNATKASGGPPLDGETSGTGKARSTRYYYWPETGATNAAQSQSTVATMTVCLVRNRGVQGSAKWYLTGQTLRVRFTTPGARRVWQNFGRWMGSRRHIPPLDVCWAPWEQVTDGFFDPLKLAPHR
jgi:hypothetical protein